MSYKHEYENPVKATKKRARKARKGVFKALQYLVDNGFDTDSLEFTKASNAFTCTYKSDSIYELCSIEKESRFCFQ